MRIIAHLLSIIFHPFLMPTYGVLFILWAIPYVYSEFDTVRLNSTLISFFALTFVFPSFSLLVMKGLDLINSLKLDKRQDRIIPFIVVSTFYFWTYWMFRDGSQTVFGSNPYVGNLMLGICLAVFVAFFLNIFMKVSIHTLGMGGALAFLILVMPAVNFNMILPISITILLAGLVGMSRLILSAHKPKEVYIGYLLGFFGQFAAAAIHRLVDMLNFQA